MCVGHKQVACYLQTFQRIFTMGLTSLSAHAILSSLTLSAILFSNPKQSFENGRDYPDGLDESKVAVCIVQYFPHSFSSQRNALNHSSQVQFEMNSSLTRRRISKTKSSGWVGSPIG